MKLTWKWMSALWLFPAMSALAQAGSAAEANPPSDMLTLAELMRMGGWLMYVLAALSVLGVALIVYYTLVLRSRAIAPPAQALRLRELLKEKRGREARDLCAQQPTALASVASAGLDFLKENPNAKSGMLKEIMESEGSRQAGRMQNMIHYLLDLSAVAPMVGLLGTVIGMLPGLGPATGVAVLIPITYGMNPTTALITMCAVYYGAMFGGSIASIMINTPGDASSIVTCGT